jgi:hypothetical protein
MRRRFLILALALGLVSISSNAQADASIDALEELVRQDPVTHARLYQFFKKQKVKYPVYYAKLLTGHKKAKIMASILVVESHGDNKAVSSAGAVGPFQVMPFWKKTLKIKGSLHNPAINLHAASRVYDIYLKDAGGNHNKALYAYSGGSTWYPRKINNLIKEI